MIHIYEAKERTTALQYAAEDVGVPQNEVQIVKTLKLGALFSKERRVGIVVKVESKLEYMIIDFIEHTLSYMNCPVRATIERRAKDKIWLQIKADRPAILIRRNNTALHALQYLATVFTQRHADTEISVALNVYRQRGARTRSLEQQVREAARAAHQSGTPQSLPPMSSYQRYQVHQIARTIKGVSTVSEGSGSRRRVRIVVNERT